MDRTKMTKRMIFGAIMIAVLAGVLWGDWAWEQATARKGLEIAPGTLSLEKTVSPGLLVTVLLAVILMVGFLELRRFAAAAGTPMLPAAGFLGTVALGICPYWVPLLCSSLRTAAPFAIFLPPVLLALIFAEAMAHRRTEGAFGRVAATALAVAYLGGCGAVVLMIRLGFSVPALVLFLVAAKSTDIGAYFTGSFFGKHKLIPWLSPGKSWEGLLGGIAVSAGLCMLLVALAGWCQWQAWPFVYPPVRPAWVPSAIRAMFESAPPALPGLAKAALFGAVVGLVGQFADLCESLLKRSASLKDSGALVPEFGGVLDIIDSLLLSAPVAAILLAVMA